MKLPLSWLRDYIDPGLSPNQLSKLLTLAGLEVDGMESVGSSFTRVVVGKVLEVEKHPNADKLCVARVTDGTETYQVVCGAPNCRPGLKTALALMDAVLRDENGSSFTVKKGKLRGVESFGMLCSAKELHMGDESDGIMELPESYQEGTDLSSIYSDTIFEISLTPNLGHCASVEGVAREISASTGVEVKYPQITLEESKALPIAKQVKVTVNDPKGCPRYAARLITGVKVGPSPEWMQRRLIASGLRPVNNIVDITNYVVLEMGQPLHAFDFERLDGHQIIVRSARDDERFVTLDDKERILKAGDILICDANKPVAIAGVMGGKNSEVSDSTTQVLLEAAYFHPGTIRKTSKRLGLQTDASKRFERNCDPNQVLRSLNRAAMLIQQLAGDQVAEGTLDVAATTFENKAIVCRLARVNQILGVQLSLNEVEGIFKRLGFVTKLEGQEQWTVSVPTYRADITGEIDLIEEVGRIYGFENIRKKATKYSASSLPHVPIFLFEREIRTRLVAEGLQEFVTCDLIGPTMCAVAKEALMPPEAIVKVLNPTSIEQSLLRTSLLPGLLQLVKYNIDHQNHDVSGFEVGRIHFKAGEAYKEQAVAGIVLTGKSTPNHWDKKAGSIDFFEIKGIVENLLNQVNIPNITFKNKLNGTFHTGRQASIFSGDLEIGTMGEIHPTIQRRLDVTQRIYYAELNLQDLMQVRKKEQKMQPLPIYPSSERDWTITLKEETSIQTLFEIIKSIPSSLLEEVSVIDIYRSERVGAGLKNVTLHLVYRDWTKTVEQVAVDAEHQRLTEQVVRVLEKR
ncbi:MAG: phenylalanine--tRNA ligase subunit beta [Parachlamydiaceae bacterium]|nr:phenylalanine--tRNA ligase subunit beta [Parachlamydiaceae bacterium]